MELCSFLLAVCSSAFLLGQTAKFNFVSIDVGGAVETQVRGVNKYGDISVFIDYEFGMSGSRAITTGAQL